MRHVAWVGLLAGCIQTETIVCEQGTDFERTCGEADVCDDAHHLCVSPDQLTACASSAELEACSTTVIAAGTCRDGICLPAFCGDGIALGREECDGEDLKGMTCEALGFYEPSPLSCITTTCSFDTSACIGYCGDGVLAPGIELCDVGHEPPVACVEFGYGAGYLACNSFTCGPDFTDCKYFGWRPASYAPRELGAIDGTDDTSVFAVGVKGLVRHWDGDSWQTIDTSACNLGAVDLVAVDAIGPGQAWVAGHDTAFGDAVAAFIDGTSCTRHIVVAANDSYEISATGPNDVWVATTLGAYHYDGATWTQQDGGSSSFSIYAAAPNDVYVVSAVASPNVRHFDGSTWQTLTPPTTVRHVRGKGSGDVYFGTSVQTPAVLRYDGATWIPLPTLTDSSQVHSITFAGTRLYVGMQDAAGASSIRMFDGTEWVRLSDPPELAGQRRHVYASPTGILYAAGRDETPVTRNDRTDLVEHPSIFSAVGQNFLSAMASSTGTAWVVRSDGSLFVYRGNEWNLDSSLSGVRQIHRALTGEVVALTSGSSSTLRIRTSAGIWTAYNTVAATRLWAASPTDIWLAGTGSTPNVNTLRHWNGSSDSVCASCDLGVANLGLFGVAADAVYAWGSGNGQYRLHQWNGSTWSTVTTPWSELVKAMTGWARNDVVAVTRVEGVFHFDGTAWTSLDFPIPNFPLDYVWGASLTDLFVANGRADVFHYDGTHWTPVRVPGQELIAQLTGAGESVWFFDRGVIRQLLRVQAW